MPPAKSKFYAVKKGRVPGIYQTCRVAPGGGCIHGDMSAHIPHRGF